MKKIFLFLLTFTVISISQAQTVTAGDSVLEIQEDSAELVLKGTSPSNGIWQLIQTEVKAADVKADDMNITIDGTPILLSYNAEHGTYTITFDGETTEYESSIKMKSALKKLIETQIP